jgi:Tol biopolymer transport system component
VSISVESEQPLWTFSTGGGTALRLANVIAHDATWMPDGKRVLYAAGNRLFISKLEDETSTPFATLPGRAFWLRWSPDGNILRFTPMDPVDHTLGLWETSNPSWSDDGQSIVFGRIPDIMGKEDGPRALQILDLRTHKQTQLPGSEGLFSPRRSPDGRYIAAISLDQRRLLLST